jgi:alkylation response protein AidB-like acyl-CoA dehydrogenase
MSTHDIAAQTPTPDQFIKDALAFLSTHLDPRGPEGEFRWGVGSDDVAIFHDRAHGREIDQELERARWWQQTKFDNGFGWIDGDPQYGGAGLPTEFATTFARLELEFDAPDQDFFGVALGMVAPTIAAEASPELRQRYLRGLHRGDILACQLFSEPSAGSDLSNVTTTAIRDGDRWVVNGQKVWTSGAQYSDIGLLLAKTEADQPQRQALTMFIVDMHAEGVEVRPLRQMTGGAHFNEVFLTDAIVPDTHRVGAAGTGFRVAITTLMSERASVGSGPHATLGCIPAAQLVALLEHSGHAQHQGFRQEAARLVALSRVAELTTARLLAEVPAGEVPGPQLSAAKLLRTELMSGIANFVTDVLGQAVSADTEEWGTYAWAAYILAVPGMRVAGGTDEILRNTIAERVLGLPREARTTG